MSNTIQNATAPSLRPLPGPLAPPSPRPRPDITASLFDAEHPLLAQLPRATRLWQPWSDRGTSANQFCKNNGGERATRTGDWQGEGANRGRHVTCR